MREFFISYDKIRTNAPKKLIKWDVVIANADGNPVSEVRTFVVDYSFQNHARYFLFKNTLGVYDLVRVTGRATKKIKSDKEIVRISLPLNFPETSKQETQISNITTTTYSINSGYLSREESDNFQQFIDSDDVYWLKRNKAYPVTLQNNSRTASEDEDYLPFSEFELTHAIHDDFTEAFSANEPILTGDFSIDFNTDYFVGDVVVVEPETPASTVLFQSDFSSWTERTISVNGDSFSPLPLGLSLSDGTQGKVDAYGNTDNSSVVKENNAMRVDVHGNFMYTSNGGLSHYGSPNAVFMTWTGNYMHTGLKYRISLDVVELTTDDSGATNIVIFGSSNTHIADISHTGQFSFETTPTQATIFRFMFSNGNFLIDNLLIEQIN